jgi:hypothetical protein
MADQKTMKKTARSKRLGLVCATGSASAKANPISLSSTGKASGTQPANQ